MYRHALLIKITTRTKISTLRAITMFNNCRYDYNKSIESLSQKQIIAEKMLHSTKSFLAKH